MVTQSRHLKRKIYILKGDWQMVSASDCDGRRRASQNSGWKRKGRLDVRVYGIYGVVFSRMVRLQFSGQFDVFIVIAFV